MSVRGCLDSSSLTVGRILKTGHWTLEKASWRLAHWETGSTGPFISLSVPDRGRYTALSSSLELPFMTDCDVESK